MLANSTFAKITSDDVLKQPFADVIEALDGRELEPEVSETVRSQEKTSLPIESNGREYLLVLRPLTIGDNKTANFTLHSGALARVLAR